MKKSKIGIVAFAFGAPSAIASNEQIAKIASQEAKNNEADIYTQSDIIIKHHVNTEIEYTTEEAGNPPPTLRIARGAIQWSQKKGLLKIIVVAAKPHLWRAIRDLREAAKEKGIQLDIIPSALIKPTTVWFCQNSLQPRTRSKWLWWRREVLLKIMPFFIYKKVAS